ncbi:MAG: type I-E CRISPR-associated protein Cas7/Cse4/CasC [Anaerolineaceae bacterium]|jgi:CRISPR system Cascade subunit CasC
MLIQIHILQNYAPANLNRDDTGAPKDAFFGGYRRGRISSQCLKRSIRKSSTFTEAFKESGLLGIKTKGLPDLIGEQLNELKVDDESKMVILARVPEIGKESKKRGEGETSDTEEESEVEEKSETRQLIFIGINELRPLAEKLLTEYYRLGAREWKKAKIGDITRALGSSLPRSVDIALFGRMTTSAAFEDVQAAAQVAHAISTNTLTQEFDYYTAVDDISGESGAGMIGDVEFNSSTYYKYLNIHWEGLVNNLGGDIEVARQAVLALLEAATTAQPTGKQNSFAAFNLPDLVLVEVTQKNLPVSYTNAFIKPARASGDQSVMDASFAKLGDYLKRVTQTFNLDGKRAFTSTQDYSLPAAESKPSMNDLKKWLDTQLPR